MKWYKITIKIQIIIHSWKKFVLLGGTEMRHGRMEIQHTVTLYMMKQMKQFIVTIRKYISVELNVMLQAYIKT